MIGWFTATPRYRNTQCKRRDYTLIEKQLAEASEAQVFKGTSFSFIVKQYHIAQNLRIACQLRLIATAKNTLLLNGEKDSEFKQIHDDFLLMIENKKPFEKQLALVKPAIQILGKWDEQTEWLYFHYKDIEDTIDLNIIDTVRRYRVWNTWLSQVQGIAEHTAGLILGGYESAFGEGEGIGHFETASQMCAFAGLGKPGQKRVEGQKLTFNKQLKSDLMGRLGASILKQSPEKSGYRRMYDAEKVRITRRCQQNGITIVPALKLPINNQGKRYEPEGMISVGHIHWMTLHNTVKKFIHHLFEEWRKAEGLPSRLPYVFEKLGHPKSSYIPPVRDRN
jgi:hypothetical protein